MRASVGMTLALAMGVVLIASGAVLAATLEGNVVQIQAVHDTSSTVWDWLSGFVTQNFSLACLLGGGAGVLSGFAGRGLAGIGVGAAVPMFPSISAGGMTDAPAATLGSLTQFVSTAWWQMSPADPVVLLAIGLSCWLFYGVRRQQEVTL